ncbi:LacI family DNA-binding transcriptional regulator [Pseudactinotalea sp. HY160]|nr:LacI family DNA-binding transcriptional regulator [Pseudactinotalea sp. HY160]MPV50264.1 LacI family DNA-binding transcriptional regulator [Pseudactinotalea sp. HY160]QGH71069.1 LacI family DNA-binding transcriptional regulator [Pseudactinotalea sp. HY158]
MTDVARLAGVSPQTVSRTLRGHSYVSAATREKVMDAVHTLGYRMNTAARALSSGRTRTIGVMTMATGSYAGAVTQMSIDQRAAAHGYAVVGAQVGVVDPRAIGAGLQRLAAQGVEGLVLALPLGTIDPGSESLLRALPTVTIGGSATTVGESLALDQRVVAELATAHLLGLGHGTVHLLAGPDDWIDAANRTAGWRTTLTAAGRRAPAPHHGDWSPESGYQAGLALGRDPDVTAILAASDDMAFGVIRALHELGLRVPEDVSVVGVDDIDLAAYCSPALTTVAQPFRELGRAAVDHVVARLEHRHPSDEPPVPAPRLVVRSSTGPARRPDRPGAAPRR